MKRIVTWLLSTISVVVLLFGYHTSTAGSLATPVTAAATPGTTSMAATSGNAAPGQSGSGAGGAATPKKKAAKGKKTAKPAAKATAKAASATITGQTVQTRWGPVQVQVDVSSGRIANVTVLQYPSSNPEDQQIAAYALPILIQETQQAQSAHIDMVSGATYTSAGYIQSLQSALDQAGI